MADLDQSGNAFQQIRVSLGPSLGTVMMQVRPTRFITSGGSVTLAAGDSVVMVNVAASVTINLPSVASWIKESAYNPMTAFERAIWIKDLGGNAAAFPITIQPVTLENIDATFNKTLNTAHAIARLYPLPDLTGWFVA